MGILGMHDAEEIGQKKVRASHAGGYHASDGIELVAVADLNESALAQFGTAWDIEEDRHYTDYNVMLSEEELDVISVCTPTIYHHEHVVDSAQSDADPEVIWCEKPIASNVHNAEEMVSTCADTGTELVINHSFRFTDKLQRLKELVTEENLLGEVQSVSTQYRMELMRNSTHVLDTLVYLLDAEPSRVSGYINGENEAIETLDVDRRIDDAGGGGFVVMNDGTFATIDCTIPRDQSSMMFQFIGDEGKVYLNNDDGEWRYWNLESGHHVEEPFSGIDGAWTWDTDYRAAFPNAASHIVDLLDGNAGNASPGEEAIRSLEVIVGFYISHFTNATVSLPLDQSLRDVTVTSW